MKRENGFTLIELLLVIAILGILCSIAVMSVLRSRSVANESAAVGSIRSVTSAQIAYTATCGNGGFAESLVTLGVPSPGSLDPFLSPDMTGGAIVNRSGYRIQVLPSAGSSPAVADCNGTMTSTGFYVTGEPIVYGTSGSRSFAVASPNVTIWEVRAAIAPAEPFAAPASPIQ